MQREIIVPHVPHVVPTTHIRSTILQTSLSGLRERGHFERWSQAIADSARTAILECVGPQWLDVQLAVAHFSACEALMLPKTEVDALGALAGERVRSTFIGSIMKMANQSGITPWLPILQAGRVWPRIFQGGSMQMVKIGPKDCEFEISGNCLSSIPYYRDAFAALVRAAVQLFGVRKSIVKITRARASDFVFVVSWV